MPANSDIITKFSLIFASYKKKKNIEQNQWNWHIFISVLGKSFQILYFVYVLHAGIVLLVNFTYELPHVLANVIHCIHLYANLKKLSTCKGFNNL